MKPRLGEILVQLGYLSPPQLEGTLVHHRQWRVALGRSAVICGFCTEQQVIQGLSRQLGYPAIDLDRTELESAFSPLISERVAARHRAISLGTKGKRSEILVVAMSPPAALDSQDAVRAFTRKSKLEVHLASDEAIERAIARVYRGVETDRALELGMKGDASLGFLTIERSPAGLAEQLGLSRRAREVVDNLAMKHSVETGEVVRRLVEMWVSDH